MSDVPLFQSKMILDKLHEVAHHAGAPASVVEEAINEQLSSASPADSMEAIIGYIIRHGDAKVALERAQAADGILKA